MITETPVVLQPNSTEAARELVRVVATAPDLDAGLRELRAGLVRLGFARVSIWLIPPTDPTVLRGTWGTDQQGREVDEHGLSQPLSALLSSHDLLDGRRVVTRRESRAEGSDVLPYHAAVNRTEATSVLVAALRAGGQLFGVVTVDRMPTSRTAADQDIALLESLAPRVAATLVRRQTVSALNEKVIRGAVERAERVQEEVVASRRLATVIAQIGAAADIEQALEALLRGAIELVRGDAGSVLMGDWRTGGYVRELHVANGGPLRQSSRAESRQEPDIVAQRCASGEAKLVVDSLASDQPISILDVALRARGARSAISVPIEAGAERIGSLTVHHQQPGAFTAADLAVAAALAAKAGIVIERSRLQEAERGEILARLAAEETLARRYVAAEAARSESQAILDATGQAMILATPELEILTINRRGEELFGVTQDDGRTWAPEEVHAVFARAFGDDADDLLTSALRVDAERRFRLDLRQRYPEQRDIELYTTPVHGADGQTYGRLYVFRDVTRERDIDRMKSDFVSLVSHELRTPLTSVKGYLALVLAGEVGPLQPEQARFLRIAQTNTDRLAAIVNDLLDLSRIDAGKLDLRRAPVDLRVLLSQAVATLYPQVQARRQRLTLTVPPALPRLLADGERLSQVFLNLLSNAHKYTPDEGSIAVVVTHEGPVVRIDVRDSGIGMSSGELDRLFTRYYRAQNASTRAITGAGLGLAITRSLVELHGGEIRVTSEPDRGSTFSVLLPVALAAAG